MLKMNTIYCEQNPAAQDHTAKEKDDFLGNLLASNSTLDERRKRTQTFTSRAGRERAV